MCTKELNMMDSILLRTCFQVAICTKSQSIRWEVFEVIWCSLQTLHDQYRRRNPSDYSLLPILVALSLKGISPCSYISTRSEEWRSKQLLAWLKAKDKLEDIFFYEIRKCTEVICEVIKAAAWTDHIRPTTPKSVDAGSQLSQTPKIASRITQKSRYRFLRILGRRVIDSWDTPKAGWGSENNLYLVALKAEERYIEGKYGQWIRAAASREVLFSFKVVQDQDSRCVTSRWA